MKMMMTIVILAVLMAGGIVTTGRAQEVHTPIPASIKTPDRVESKIGTLQFRDGYPTAETAAKIRDELDYLHGVEAFMNSIQGVSMYALRKGFAEVAKGFAGVTAKGFAGVRESAGINRFGIGNERVLQ